MLLVHFFSRPCLSRGKVYLSACLSILSSKDVGVEGCDPSLLLVSKQEEYQAEGITWHNIDYTDNVGCIHLISKKPTGLLYLLDEESK